MKQIKDTNSTWLKLIPYCDFKIILFKKYNNGTYKYSEENRLRYLPRYQIEVMNQVHCEKLREQGELCKLPNNNIEWCRKGESDNLKSKWVMYLILFLE